ncbi:MarR family transcriptional regulator [Bradyrhizobium sp. KB893862 SZCCT0404]|uniref:MarR family winged helix-turn-helix transcriptional regulator n=1 Tax=Bradyrhizobium sp. KB893862 SZCCT0404 TaxID=2807672 RepID=UPI001BA9957C|nr:MarR family transcriptional regulator [Bradyrhizobium sp. KB893862 SZCCT0404]MBR1175302.1 MarR family transcriptional regulator [Bradyrhizobium sp. KB893862 SZCCT0404]
MSGPDSARKQADFDDSELVRLKDFLPYKLVVLADQISRSLSELYEERFGLTRQEWRVLAALADNGSISSLDVSRYSTLDPMAVSRASSLLEEKGYIVREQSSDDGRLKVLRSTRSGRALYRKIMPLAIDREKYLTEPLSPAERASFEATIDKLLMRSRTLATSAAVEDPPEKAGKRSISRRTGK